PLRGRPPAGVGGARHPAAPLLHLRIDRRSQGRRRLPGPAGRRRAVAGAVPRRAGGRRALPVHADVPRQRRHRRMGARARRRAAPGDDLAVVDPETGEERPRAVLDAGGRLINGDEAIGELVNRSPRLFEGYWKNPEAAAARTRGGCFWTGDLFFRDQDGYFHF